ncbi:MAG: hypothetical protein AAGE52_17010 [Myxococcota bacterium]
MSGPLLWLIAAIVLGAAVLVAHVALLWGTVTSNVDRHWKWLALVPLLTPVAGWRAELRKTVVVWGIVVTAYVVVRIAA